MMVLQLLVINKLQVCMHETGGWMESTSALKKELFPQTLW